MIVLLNDDVERDRCGEICIQAAELDRIAARFLITLQRPCDCNLKLNVSK